MTPASSRMDVPILALGVALLAAAPAAGQTDDEEFRTICRMPALRTLALAQARPEKRRELEIELENRCRQIDDPTGELPWGTGVVPKGGRRLKGTF